MGAGRGYGVEEEFIQKVIINQQVAQFEVDK